VLRTLLEIPIRGARGARLESGVRDRFESIASGAPPISSLGLRAFVYCGAMRLRPFGFSLLSFVAIALGVAPGARAQVFTEVHLGAEDFVTILNSTASGINLAGYTLRLRSSAQGPIDFALPAGTLEVGDDVSVSDLPAVGFDIDLGQSLLWSAGTDVSVALLDPLDSTIDFVALGTVVLDPPPGISFVPAAVDISSLDVNTESVVRISASGSTPTFLESNWAIGAKMGPAHGNLTPIPAVPSSSTLGRGVLLLLLYACLTPGRPGTWPFGTIGVPFTAPTR
jgi:hypothetical protein